ncbi:MAG TPA: NAD(+)/NADH kinase, partial [Ktedonobacterales bacterium]|nr:NAD(+)/NADH kinase [Ktedonobacterales bacterium]
EEAGALAQRLEARLQALGRVVWLAPASHEATMQERLGATELLIVLGGDGSLISAARLCAPTHTPLLGINFGRVGFLTELEPDEVDDKLPLYLEGNYWTDERSMLRVVAGDPDPTGVPSGEWLALNDIVLARGAEPHLIRIHVWVDSHPYNTTIADGIIVSTATGSTAYNLAAGGPILYPQVRSNVLTPIAPHLVADRSLILEPNAVITLELDAAGDSAILSADGQINGVLAAGSRVTISTSPHITRFLRRRSPTDFYRILNAKLRANLE